jgi:drug/metabolite transporter (DMT)-like permease
MVIFGLFVYALVWQQMLKRLPLVTAYANKAVTVVWGIIWGYVFFGEKVTVNKLIGAVIVIAGVVLVVASDADAENKADPDTDECAGNGGAI